MIKRISITILINLILLFAFIYLQITLATKSINQELTNLAQLNSLLIETRILINSVNDSQLHPNNKLSNLNQAIELIAAYPPPTITKNISNPLALSSVRYANDRRHSLNQARDNLPTLVVETQSLLDSLAPTYYTLRNFFAYNPYNDFDSRSIENNSDEFISRLDMAQDGIDKTLSDLASLDITPELQQSLLTILTPIRSSLSALILTTKAGNISDSLRLQAEFSALIFPAQTQLDQLLTSSSNLANILEKSRNASLSLQSAISDSTLQIQ